MYHIFSKAVLKNKYFSNMCRGYSILQEYFLARKFIEKHTKHHPNNSLIYSTLIQSIRSSVD